MSGPTAVLTPINPQDLTSAMISTCSKCGNSTQTPEEAQLRIQDLEAQVRLLNAKAAAAVDKLADYEDEVRSLRSAYSQLQKQNQQPPLSLPPPQSQTPTLTPPPPQPTSIQTQPSTLTPPIPDHTTNTPALTPTTPTANPSSPPRNLSRLASLSSFLPGRKRDTALLAAPPPTPSVALFSQSSLDTLPSTTAPHSDPTTPAPALTPQPPTIALQTLQTSLEAERTLRLRAESNLNQTQSELEELTATLFGQANEMVAQERKARAKLEERVKVLEDRDGEKRRRLDRLEKALERIERVRGLVRQEKEMGGVRIGVVEIHEGLDDKGGPVLRVVNDVAR